MSITVAVKSISTCVTAGKMIRNESMQKRVMTELNTYYQQLNAVNERLDDLGRKADMLIIRDLLSANLALDDIKAVGSCDSAELLQLKNMYRVNTGLPMEGQTCGIPNSQVRVMSYLGLFQIGILEQSDEKRLLRYVLHMFETGEKVVWEELFPEFYRSVFLPEFENEENNRTKRKKAQEEYWAKSDRKLALDILVGIITLTDALDASSPEDRKKRMIIHKAQKLLETEMD